MNSTDFSDGNVIVEYMYERQIIENIYMCGSALSVIGSFFVLASYARFQQLRKFTFKIIALHAISDIGSAIGYYRGMGRVVSPENCFWQGILLQFFQLSAMLWTTVIAYVLHRAMTANNSMQQRTCSFFFSKRCDCHLPSICAFVWGLSFTMAVLPLSTNTYTFSPGDQIGWCFIGGNQTNAQSMMTARIWQVASWYAPLAIAVWVNVWVFWLLLSRKRGELDETEAVRELTAKEKQGRERLQSLQRRLQGYPLVLIALMLIGSANRVQQALDPERPVLVLECLHATALSTVGFANAVVYFMTDTVRSAWLEPSAARSSLGKSFASAAREPLLESVPGGAKSHEGGAWQGSHDRGSVCVV
jgi:hypothetical protein